jgi:UDP-2,4-diacetamido-2,4,6-trideoxy-beta-L-altropyranose hydrolase
VNVFVRADASPTIGTGHVRRCLAIARALRSRGAHVRFVTRPGGDYGRRLFAGSGFDVDFLPDPTPTVADRGAWLRDADETRRAMASCAARPAWLLVDHYGLDGRWERALRADVDRIFVIDDLADRAHEADVLLDANLADDAGRRYLGKIPGRCLTLFGPRYAPLRDEFAALRARTGPRHGKVRKVLVFHGGGPRAAGCTLAAVEALGSLATGELAVDVVFDAEQQDGRTIEAACSRFGFGFHPGTPRLAQLMAEAGLAIGAGGTTLWERCCLGLPSIAFALADNQQDQLRQAALQGVVLAPSVPADDAAALARHVAACLENPGQLEAVSRQAMALVDGRGTGRLLRVFGLPGVDVRAAGEADCEQVLAWRNDATVRLASHDCEPIDLPTHRRWFASALSDPRRLLLIGERDGEPVGVVRYDIDGTTARVSIFLAPGRAGAGLGADLLAAGEARLRASKPEIERIVAEVLGDNQASRRLFTAAGYSLREARFEQELR